MQLFGAVESTISPWGSILVGTDGLLKSGEIFHQKNILQYSTFFHFHTHQIFVVKHLTQWYPNDYIIYMVDSFTQNLWTIMVWIHDKSFLLRHARLHHVPHAHGAQDTKPMRLLEHLKWSLAASWTTRSNSRITQNIDGVLHQLWKMLGWIINHKVLKWWPLRSSLKRSCNQIIINFLPSTNCWDHHNVIFFPKHPEPPIPQKGNGGRQMKHKKTGWNLSRAKNSTVRWASFRLRLQSLWFSNWVWVKNMNIRGWQTDWSLL